MKNFFIEFFTAFANCFKGFNLLFNRGLWPYIIYPLIIFIAFYALSVHSIFVLADWLSQQIVEYVQFKSIPDHGHWLSYIKRNLSGILGFLLKIILWFLNGTLVKYIVLILLSPIFALLSERTDERITGNNFPFSFKQLIKDIFRGIAISLRNLLLEYSIMLACFIITLFLPFMVVISFPLIILSGWYFVGFALLDYNSERYRFTFSESIKFIKAHKGTACGIGCVYWLFMLLPFLPGDVIGIMFGPALAVIGATISFLDITKAELPGN
jgi:CysZ protein